MWRTVVKKCFFVVLMTLILFAPHGLYAVTPEAIGNLDVEAQKHSDRERGFLTVPELPDTHTPYNFPINNYGRATFVVDWTETPATYYEVFQSVNGGSFVKIAQPSASAIQLTRNGNGNRWCYRIRAYEGGLGGRGYSGYSNTQCAYVGPPTAPTVTAPSSNFSGSFQVSWSSVESVRGYRLFQQKDSGNWTLIRTTAGTSYSASNRLEGTWCFRVHGYNDVGTGPYSNIDCTNVVFSPNAPTLSTPTTDNDGEFVVSWSTIGNATSYHLNERQGSGSWSSVYVGSGTQLNRTGKGEGSWCYQVRAYNAAGYSAFSSTQCTEVIFPPNTPGLNAPDSTEDGTYLVTWESVAKATSYELDERPENGSWKTIFNGPGTSYQISDQSGGQWCYRVRAASAQGHSDWSPNQCVAVNHKTYIPTISR